MGKRKRRGNRPGAAGDDSGHDSSHREGNSGILPGR